jgi:hypothetical protein
MKHSDLQPELQDTLESINRFLALNKKKDICLAGILAVFDEEGELIEDRNVMFAYGDKQGVRDSISALRDKIEDNSQNSDKVDM